MYEYLFVQKYGFYSVRINSVYMYIKRINLVFKLLNLGGINVLKKQNGGLVILQYYMEMGDNCDW